MASFIEQIRDYLSDLAGTSDIDDLKSVLDNILTALSNIKIDADTINLNTDTLEALAAAQTTQTISGNSTLEDIDSNTDRNTDYEILNITLSDDNWHDVTFAQAVKEFKIQERGLSADIWFRKSVSATNYVTVGAGDTMPFKLAMASTTVGQVCRKTGAGTIYAAVFGKF